MKKGRNTAKILGSEVEFDDIELSEGEGQERMLTLKAAPRPRRLQLIEQGRRKCGAFAATTSVP
jgi:hypothetical protein